MSTMSKRKLGFSLVQHWDLRGVYGFGALLFQLIAARNPQQGLMEYAAMNAEEKVVDSRLNGRFDLQEVIEVTAFAYRCISRAPRKRPNMRDVVEVF
ncbi:hypothetical protein HID58_009365 [Brassica napus]|uniref:Protein kinase domain-containing protein n=1 Tax=Brassica napus TaxID=3708 RepID=A0ABQ8DSF4_BRANA|nr:hypothetical protein HID58_009365 [Brassica napus]